MKVVVGGGYGGGGRPLWRSDGRVHLRITGRNGSDWEVDVLISLQLDALPALTN